MKKNGEYVGVDEKFIPENEKYVDESLLGDKKQSEAKAKKIVKGIGVTHICIIGFLLLLVLVSCIVIPFMYSNRTNKLNSKYDISSFNSYLEMYSGTEKGSSVARLLEEVVTSNKTKDRIITVIYKETTTSAEDEIVNIKHSLDKWEEYEVSLDYDAQGYINKITIKDI